MIFSKKETSYNLWNNAHFSQRNIKSLYYETQIISCLGPKIWNLAPESIKDSGKPKNLKVVHIGYVKYTCQLGSF